MTRSQLGRKSVEHFIITTMDIVHEFCGRQEDGSLPISEFNAAQRRLLGIHVSLITIIVFVMGIRLYSRIAITKSIGADDCAYNMDDMVPWATLLTYAILQYLWLPEL